MFSNSRAEILFLRIASAVTAAVAKAKLPTVSAGVCDAIVAATLGWRVALVTAVPIHFNTSRRSMIIAPFSPTTPSDEIRTLGGQRSHVVEVEGSNRRFLLQRRSCSTDALHPSARNCP